MPLDATGFGYVSMLWDEPSPADSTTTKVGGLCVVGTATSAVSLGDIVIVDSAADDSYKTTTSANSTARAGFVVAGLNTVTAGGWDFQTTSIASGSKILIGVKGVFNGTSSTTISRGSNVGTSTTAGQVATTSTQDAVIGKTLTASTGAAQSIRILV